MRPGRGGHVRRRRAVAGRHHLGTEQERESFSVSAAFGAVFLPGEAIDPTAALKLADERLYAQKLRLHGGRRGEPYEVLLRVLTEREPSLREHVDSVADLSIAVGARLGLGEASLEEPRLAAELHDVG